MFPLKWLKTLEKQDASLSAGSPEVSPTVASEESTDSVSTTVESTAVESTEETESTLLHTLLKVFSPRNVTIVLVSCMILASFIATLITALILGQIKPLTASTNLTLGRQELSITPTKPGAQAWKPIISRNLFNPEGTVADEDPASSQKKTTGDMMATSLPFKLLGTVYGGDPYGGIAMIENTEKKSKNSFVVGDRLTGGVTVYQVLRKKVILSNAGQLEYLPLEEPKLKRRRRGGRSVLSNMSPLVERQPMVHSEGRLSQFKEEGYEYTGDKIFMTENYKKKLLTQDFSKVLQDAKADPYMVGGRLAGFILTRIRKDSIYEKSGFANGDIIKEINGIELTSASQAIGVLQAARNAQRLEVTVVQNGITRIIEVNIGQ